MEVVLIEIMDRILPRLFDEGPAFFLQKILEDVGIKVLVNEKAIEIVGNETVQGLATDKREIDCDMVVMGAGIRPNTELANHMGLEIGQLGGIITNDYMETSVKNIYACGDCIESRDIITGQRSLSLLWPNAKRQGWIAGYNCIGEGRRYTGSFNATTIDIIGIYACSAGKTAADSGRGPEYGVIEKKYDSTYYCLTLANQQLAGIQLITKIGHAGSLVSKMLRKDNFAELRKMVLDDKYLSLRPWNYWIKHFI